MWRRKGADAVCGRRVARRSCGNVCPLTTLLWMSYVHGIGVPQRCHEGSCALSARSCRTMFKDPCDGPLSGRIRVRAARSGATAGRLHGAPRTARVRVLLRGDAPSDGPSRLPWGCGVHPPPPSPALADRRRPVTPRSAKIASAKRRWRRSLRSSRRASRACWRSRPSSKGRADSAAAAAPLRMPRAVHCLRARW